MVSAHKTERDAEVALVALHRACFLEGLDSLGSDELAVRIGFKKAKQLEQAVVDCMVQRGWVSEQGPELTLTSLGRKHAERRPCQTKCTSP